MCHCLLANASNKDFNPLQKKTHELMLYALFLILNGTTMLHLILFAYIFYLFNIVLFLNCV